MENKEYDIEPKQAWRLARRLLQGIVYEPGMEEKNEWIYASTESQQLQRTFEEWIVKKNINTDTNIWVLISYPAEDTKEMKWMEFLNRLPEFLSDTDLKICDKKFTWVLEYNHHRVARFGRKVNIG